MNEERTEIKYDLDYCIVAANELIRGKHNELTLLEAKLIRLAISQVLQSDTDLRTYTCDVVDLARFLGMDKGNIYREMDDLTTDLLTKVIIIRGKGKRSRGKYSYMKFPWVDFVEYQNGTITIRLSDKLKPYLIGLEQMFTSYSYSEIIKLPTTYSIRLYELLASFMRMPYQIYPDTNPTDVSCEKNQVAFDISYLREYFNCTEKYSNTGDFIKRIIAPAVEAINHTQIWKDRFLYEKIKKGKSIIAIRFTFNELREINREVI